MVSTVSQTSGTGSTVTRQTMADNFDTFLQILMAQLKNQNPLEPMDTNQFTQQLVQFSAVEQQLQTNDYLENLVIATQSNLATQALNYIGKTIEASGTTTEIQSGFAQWSYTTPSDASDVTFTIRDASGNILVQDNRAISAGSHNYIWDGSIPGGKLNSGTYTLTIEARTQSGTYVPVSTKIAGTVTGFDLTEGSPYLFVGDLKVPISAIQVVR